MTLLHFEYWPSISHCCKLYLSNEVLMEQQGTYQKQSLFNRCKIAGVNGILTLSVPLIGGRSQRTLVEEVSIDHSQRWAIQHVRTLRSCYGKAPFFDYYYPVVEEMLMQKQERMLVLNEVILKQVVKWLQWKGSIERTSSFQLNPKKVAEVTAFTPYVQVFSDKVPFAPDLSILDALFCLGPQTRDYLAAQAAFIV